jgi:hypothetical protein
LSPACTHASVAPSAASEDDTYASPSAPRAKRMPSGFCRKSSYSVPAARAPAAVDEGGAGVAAVGEDSTAARVG